MGTLMLEIIKEKDVGKTEGVKRVMEIIISTLEKTEEKLLVELGELKTNRYRIEHSKTVTVDKVGRSIFYSKIRSGIKVFNSNQIKKEKEKEKILALQQTEKTRLMKILLTEISGIICGSCFSRKEIVIEINRVFS